MNPHVDQRFIIAGEARRVRHPGGRLLTAAGETVDWNSYWERLKQAGDVVETDPPAASSRKQPKSED